ncbi:MAG: Lrp/AsnC family transcriptional regulator [Burkholderiales bacterium]
MNPLELRLINEHQRGFPLCHAPFAEIARKFSMKEEGLLHKVAELIRRGLVSRVGPVFAPQAVGASTLAALEVPAQRVPEVAALVNRYPQVNHNYLREHRINLWFVATAADSQCLAQTLESIEAAAGCGALLRCPLIEEYRIDLGFDLTGAPSYTEAATFVRRTLQLNEEERRIVGALQNGLPIEAHPYERVAERAGLSEATLLQKLRHWTGEGVIRRFGFVARHLELGYSANAMVVWQVPETQARHFGMRLAREEGVTLCYLRAAVPPRWPYNLYCMVHAQERATAEQCIERITQRTGLLPYPRAVLFSTARYKQRGARYGGSMELAHV